PDARKRWLKFVNMSFLQRLNQSLRPEVPYLLKMTLWMTLLLVEVDAITAGADVAMQMLTFGYRWTGGANLSSLPTFYPAFGLALYASVPTYLWTLIAVHASRKDRLVTTLQLPESVQLREGGNKEILAASTLATAPFLFAGVVVTLWVYSALVFPHVGRVVGGGRPEQVVVSTTDPKLEGILSLPECQVYLIHQTDKYILLQVRKGREIVDRIYVPAGRYDFFRIISHGKDS
ncbi:MAG TPA: hypothetical protein VNT01_01610, partial [Symbiobacteriaceae bacterium]|nr:hypothetical protein [Symbiobacteriaceae bacterium]